MTLLAQSEVYQEWLMRTERNRADIFEAFDKIWEKQGNVICEVGENVKIFHSGKIISCKDLCDKPIFGSEDKDEAESYLNFDGPNQRKLCTFQTLRTCKFAHLGGSFEENGFSELLRSKGIDEDPLRAISAREWAANKEIDGWQRDIDKGELLVFRPLKILNLCSIQTL
jgi:hypothetical protein